MYYYLHAINSHALLGRSSVIPDGNSCSGFANQGEKGATQVHITELRLYKKIEQYQIRGLILSRTIPTVRVQEHTHVEIHMPISVVSIQNAERLHVPTTEQTDDMCP